MTAYSLILAIETSCDETSVAVVKNGLEVLANEIYSQVQTHAEYGGVVPEVAAREHIPQIITLIDSALKRADITFKNIDAIAVTYGPGLIGSLLVGVETARYLAYFWDKPLIPINHIHGHIYANWLGQESEPEFPIMTLTVSGGHNELVLLKSHKERQLIGETIDDAAGEAFDKVARLLDLGYPGGPVISRVAQTGKSGQYSLPRSWLELEWEKKAGCPGNFDFSFSGLKTAVRYLAEDMEKKKQKSLSKQEKADIALEFEKAVAEVLARKLVTAAQKYRVKEIHLAGGVSANKRLRETIIADIEKIFASGSQLLTADLTELFPKEKPIFRFPKNIVYCTDNAAMIAAAAYFMGEPIDPEKLSAAASDFAV